MSGGNQNLLPIKQRNVVIGWMGEQTEASQNLNSTLPVSCNFFKATFFGENLKELDETCRLL